MYRLYSNIKLLMRIAKNNLFFKRILRLNQNEFFFAKWIENLHNKGFRKRLQKKLRDIFTDKLRHDAYI